MKTQLDYAKERVERCREKYGENAKSTALAEQQYNALKARLEQRRTGFYPPNPVHFGKDN